MSSTTAFPSSIALVSVRQISRPSLIAPRMVDSSFVARAELGMMTFLQASSPIDKAVIRVGASRKSSICFNGRLPDFGPQP